MNRSAGQTNRVNHEPRKKDTHFLYISMPPTKILSKIIQEKLKIQNLTPSGVLITARVIRSNCRTFC